MSSARSVSIGGDAGGLERLVQADLLGRHRLDLDDLGRRPRRGPARDDRAGLVGVAGPVHGRARRRRGRLELLQQLGQPGEHVVLDRRAGHPQRLPVGQLADDLQPLVADRVRGPAQVLPQLRVGQPAPRRGRERFARDDVAPHDRRRQDLGVVHRFRSRAAPGQAAADVHQARVVGGGEHLGARTLDRFALVGEHRAGDAGVLQRERAAEPAALLGARQLDQLDPAHLAQQPQRPVAQAQHAQAVAGRVVGHPVREGRADVGHAEHVDEQLGQLVGARRDRGHPAAQRLVVLGQPRVGVADHGHARAGRGDDRVVPLERVDEPAHHRQRLGAVAAVGVHLAAAGLLQRELDAVAEAFQHLHDGPAGVGEHQVVDAGDEQRDPHGQPLEEREVPRGGGGDVRAHGGGARVGIAGGDRVDDPMVLAGADAVVRGGEVEPEQVQVGAQPHHRVVQHRVAGALGEAVVEPGVLGGERGDGGEARAAGRAVGQVGLDPQDGDRVGVESLRRPPGVRPRSPG